MTCIDYDWSDHADDQRVRRCWSEFRTTEEAQAAYEESVPVMPANHELDGRWHPPTDFLFLTDWDADDECAVVITIVYRRGDPLGLDDLPECPVCGYPTDPRVHDPCPFDPEEPDGKWAELQE